MHSPVGIALKGAGVYHGFVWLVWETIWVGIGIGIEQKSISNYQLTITFVYVTFLYSIENATGGANMEKLKKVPIQIYLEPEQDKIIRSLAATRGKSKAAVIRLCISKYLDSLPPENDPGLANMKLGSSGHRDIAEKHDAYLISLNKQA